MTPEQKVKSKILAVDAGYRDETIEVTAENVDRLYARLVNDSEHWDAVELLEVIGEFSAQEARADGFEIIHEFGDVERRMRGEQQMHMVFFRAELDHVAAPGGEAVGKDFPRPVPHRLRQRLTTVFGHKNQMILHLKNGVVSSLCHLHSPFEPYISNGMQTGNRFRCYPTPQQEQILFRWIGCQRVIYNAKVQEDRYYRAFARRLAGNAGQHAPIDQEYSRFIGAETAWLREVPSQVLRNGAVRWRQAYARFFSKLGGRPKLRKRDKGQSVWLTSELFEFRVAGDGLELHIGTKKFPFGPLWYKAHRGHDLPASIHIAHDAGQWFVSFSTETQAPEYHPDDIAAWLAGMGAEELSAAAIGIDRGVVIPFATSKAGDFDFRPVEKRRLRKRSKQGRRQQRRLSRRQKASARRKDAKQRFAVLRRKDRNLRRDFAHQVSRKLASDPRLHLFVFEDLKVKNMIAAASGRGRRAKAGLNRSILGAAWGFVRTFLQYKTLQEHKLTVFVPPHNSSRECSHCGHVSKDNRISQSEFVCQACGAIENADRNASNVIELAAFRLFLLFRRNGAGLDKCCKRLGARYEVSIAGLVFGPLYSNVESFLAKFLVWG